MAKEIRKIEGLPVSVWAERNGGIETGQSGMVKRSRAMRAMWDELSEEEQQRRMGALD